jgi:hypothetical protein
LTPAFFAAFPRFADESDRVILNGVSFSVLANRDTMPMQPKRAQNNGQSKGTTPVVEWQETMQSR